MENPKCYASVFMNEWDGEETQRGYHNHKSISCHNPEADAAAAKVGGACDTKGCSSSSLADGRSSGFTRKHCWMKSFVSLLRCWGMGGSSPFVTLKKKPHCTWAYFVKLPLMLIKIWTCNTAGCGVLECLNKLTYCPTLYIAEQSQTQKNAWESHHA